ncbi:DUF3541 domain-containing protein [Ferrimonas balearica]|uniref:DUF3541 domain-containing protein n=1 Tax=Ferrimonas balearica TaxID=44012 RepID=UPI001C990376|nr:DUF3541 domain-containing protein [Ferrimonas balearica]MBY5922720.1 DUF3541 domain-containing protein [Ferrimonas balearica]MBY5995704.1 DUF3541 domain-containing protein [Ferrimonas balearica]
MVRHSLIGLALLTLLTIPVRADNAQIAERILHTYQSQLYTLPATKAGHFGLRMYRQSGDPKYAAAIWQDMARVASTLNQTAEQFPTPAALRAEGARRLEHYQDSDPERRKARQAATAQKPEYLMLGVALLGAMARADEYGLKHREDAQLRALLRQYDFAHYSEDPALIRVWAAQLANQVYWLRQLGEGEYVEGFVRRFRAVYPDDLDAQLSEREYGNKIYGLTHLIFAASGYYQYQVDAEAFDWIYDYFRREIDTILRRCKEDIIAEVGLSFLLAGLEQDPVVAKTRAAIASALDPKAGMIPSVSGGLDLKGGEHRNVLAIMLLDWKGTRPGPDVAQHPKWFAPLPFGLVAK